MREAFWLKEPEHIYIHIPYCIKKCPYCDFPSVALAKADVTVSLYVAALQKEIEKALAKESDAIIQTIYFGGGTPSAIDAVYIKSILEIIRSRRKLADDCEITLEMNPGTFDQAKLASYYDMGINRLSVGLQSTHENLLKNLGRIHNLDDFRRTYEEARRLGFKNISMDLIFAVPEQRLQDLEEDLRFVKEIKPEHLSIYSLIIEEGTAFAKKYVLGEFPLPSDEVERKMYHKIRSFMQEIGYEHYEISSFSKEGKRSKHNLAYWNGKSYYGFGMGASSFVDGLRKTNPKELSSYTHAMFCDIQIQEEEKIEVEDAIVEFFVFRLRKNEGFSAKEYEELFSQTWSKEIQGILDQMCEEGYLLFKDGRYAYTSYGLDYADYVARAFF